MSGGTISERAGPQYTGARLIEIRYVHTMQIWPVKKKLESEDGKRNVEIRVSPDGKLFRFYENVWTAVGEEELLFHPNGGYWKSSQMSGYYAGLEECEDAARASIAWLSNT